MEKKQSIQAYCRQFRMSGMSAILDQALHEAETETASYLDYTIRLLKAEADHREQKDAQRRLKSARLPKASDLGTYVSSLTNVILCSHAISTEKGKLVSNTDHKRQKSDKLEQMAVSISLLFDEPALVIKSVDEHMQKERSQKIDSMPKPISANPLNGIKSAAANYLPPKSSIVDYELLMKGDN